MEETVDGGGGGGGGGTEKWWWAAASVCQLGAAIGMQRSGSSAQLMPLKAFAVASLFVCASATSSIALLRSRNIHTVDDMKEVGSSMKKWIRNIPMAQANKHEDAKK